DQRDDAGGKQCPRCGETSTGRFCAGCGAPLRDVACEACKQPLVAGARFCDNCGAPVSASAASNAGEPRSRSDITKLVGGAALLTLVAFVAGEIAARPSSPDANVAQSGAVTPLSAPAATDISSMSPEERA